MNSYRVQPILLVKPFRLFTTSKTKNLLETSDGQLKILLPKRIATLLKKITGAATIINHAKKILKDIATVEKIILTNELLQFYLQFNKVIPLRSDLTTALTVHILDFLAQRGLFVDLDNLPKDQTQDEKITSFGMITHNRPDNLKRGLESYLTNIQRFKHDVSFYVFDDSTDQGALEKNRLFTESLSSQNKSIVHYLPTQKKQILLQKLVQEGIPESVIKFGFLDPYNQREKASAFGANYNAMLLWTADSLLFSADDDTLCKLAKAPEFSSDIQIGLTTPSLSHWFFKDRSSAHAFLKEENDCDLLAIHEKFLGHSLYDIAQSIPLEKVGFENQTSQFHEAIFSKKGKITVSLNSLVGDSGANSPGHYLFSTEEQRSRLIQSEETYKMAFHSREIIKASKKNIIKEMGSLMLTFCGIDNKNILPPLFPLFRNSDALFGELINLTIPDSYQAYLPWTLTHAPEESRYYDREGMFMFDAYMWPVEIIRLYLRSFCSKAPFSSPIKNFEFLAEALKDLGNMEFKHYSNLIKKLAIETDINFIDMLEILTGTYPKSPSFWTNDISRLMQTQKENILSDKKLAPENLIIELGVQQAELLIQKMIKEFGELLFWWPKIIDLSKKLKG